MRIHRSLNELNQRALAHLLLLAVILVGGLLRVYQLGAKSLWIDEAFSVWMGRQPVPEMLSWVVRIDQHPPLYYLALRLEMHIGSAFGRMATPRSSASWVRALSALASTLNIPVLYVLGRRLAGRQAGLLAALILALSPFHVYLAQEARMYVLLCLSVSGAMLGLVYLLNVPPLTPSEWRPPRPADRGRRRRRRSDHGEEVGSFPRSDGEGLRWRLAWAAYILFTAAALWTHNAAILFFFSANLYFFASRNQVFRTNPRSAKSGFLPQRLNPPPLRDWILAQMGVLLLWLPWVYPFIRQATGVYREFWLPAPNWGTVAGAIQNLISAFLPSSVPAAALLWIFGVAAILWGIYRLRKQQVLLALLATWFSVPILGELLISLFRPIFYDRTLIWASIPLYLLLAIGLNSGRETQFLGRSRVSPGRHVPTALGLLILVTLDATSLHNYYSNYQKEQWDDAAAYVAQHVQDGDLILYHASWTQLPFDFYFSTDRPVTKHGLPVDLFDRGILEPKMTEGDLARLDELTQGHARIWLIYSHNWYTDPLNLIPTALAQKGRILDKQTFNGLQVQLYGWPSP